LKAPTRSPGVLYIQNPLHPFALNNLLNSVDLALVEVETLVGCVDTGDWACLLKEGDGTDPKLHDQAAQSLEALCLLSFYLRWSLPGLSLALPAMDSPEQGMLQDLVGRILSEVRERKTHMRGPLSLSDGRSNRKFILSNQDRCGCWERGRQRASAQTETRKP